MPAAPTQVFGYTDFSKEAGIEEKFLAVPNARLAGEHLKTLTADRTSPQALKITRPPNTSPKSFALPGSKPRSSPTAY